MSYNLSINTNTATNNGMFRNTDSISTQQLPNTQASFIPPQSQFPTQQQFPTTQPQSQQQFPTTQPQNQQLSMTQPQSQPFQLPTAQIPVISSSNSTFTSTANFSQPASFQQIPSSATAAATNNSNGKRTATKRTATKTNSLAANTSKNTPITPTYEINSTMAASFQAYPSETKYPYTEPLPSPYENECPFTNLFLCAANCSTNVMYFDKTLLSIKLAEFKDEPKKIYQVSIQDLKQYYAIDDKAMAAFKSHYRVQPKAILAKYTNYKQQLQNDLALNEEKIKSYQNMNGMNQNINQMNMNTNQININQTINGMNQLQQRIQQTPMSAATLQQQQSQFQQLQQLPMAQQPIQSLGGKADLGPKDLEELQSYSKYYKDKIAYLEKEIAKIVKTVNSAEEKNTTTVAYNTSTYPITDKSGKWLTISYLIPYLMFGSPTFITHTSRVLTNLLAATSYNTSIPQMTTYIETLNQQNGTNYPTTINSYLELLGSNRFTPAILGDPKFKPNSQTSKSIAKTTAANKNSDIHKIIIQTPKPIIPELLIKTPANQQIYNQYITADINNMFNSNQFDIAAVNKLHTFYNDIQGISKMLNPADMAAVASLLKLKTLDSQISIIKVKPTDIAGAAAAANTNINNIDGTISNKELVNKLLGIKTKKVKIINSSGNPVEQTLTSQPIYTYQETTINNLATLQTLYRYAISENKLSAIPEETIKSIKAKTTGDINLYQTFITLANATTTIPSQTLPDGTITPERQLPAFNVWLDKYKLQMKQAKALLNSNNSQKKTKSKKPPTSTGANTIFINDDNEEDNENEENYDDINDDVNNINDLDDSSIMDDEVAIIDDNI